MPATAWLPQGWNEALQGWPTGHWQPLVTTTHVRAGPGTRMDFRVGPTDASVTGQADVDGAATAGSTDEVRRSRDGDVACPLMGDGRGGSPGR